MQTDYRGLLIIGDPHLEGRVPGFRKDDYPRTALEKLRWCLRTANEKKLLPVILGDLFQLPRDNPNWLIVELLDMFDGKILGIYGNHDVHENQLDENDSLSILSGAERIELLDDQNWFRGILGGRPVLIGGTPWGQSLPTEESIDRSGNPLVVWLTHHDLKVPGYDAGRIDFDETLPFDIVINGHVHRRLEPYRVGHTTILTPGNITRRKRSDATREHIPSVMAIMIESNDWSCEFLEVPHQPFEDVFHEALDEVTADNSRSNFIAGLAELQARRTQTGAGLETFLDANLNEFEKPVADEIRSLAEEVLNRN